MEVASLGEAILSGRQNVYSYTLYNQLFSVF